MTKCDTSGSIHRRQLEKTGAEFPTGNDLFDLFDLICLICLICLQFLSGAGSVPNKLSAIDPTAISTQLSSQMPSKWTGQKKKQYNCNLKSLQQRVQHLSLLVQDEQQRVAATHDAQLVGAVSNFQCCGVILASVDVASGRGGMMQ